jgi:hypothetical protein
MEGSPRPHLKASRTLESSLFVLNTQRLCALCKVARVFLSACRAALPTLHGLYGRNGGILDHHPYSDGWYAAAWVRGCRQRRTT